MARRKRLAEAAELDAETAAELQRQLRQIFHLLLPATTSADPLHPMRIARDDLGEALEGTLSQSPAERLEIAWAVIEHHGLTDRLERQMQSLDHNARHWRAPTTAPRSPE